MAEIFTVLPSLRNDLPGSVLDVNFTYPVDVDTVGVGDVQIRIQGTVTEAGLYLVNFSATSHIDAFNNSMLRRFSFNGGASWEEGAEESKDPTDKKFWMYSFPKTMSALESIDYVFQMRKEADANIMEVTFANIWLTRIS